VLKYRPYTHGQSGERVEPVWTREKGGRGFFADIFYGWPLIKQKMRSNNQLKTVGLKHTDILEYASTGG